MTLLISVAGKGFLLASSDTRISMRSGGKYKTVDENFNKHIVFNCGEITADVTYTGPAQWREGGRTTRLYDVISEVIRVAVAETALAFGPLMLKLATDVYARISKPGIFAKGQPPVLELHVLARHKQLPWPFLAVLSTYRDVAPWTAETEFQWEYRLPNFNLYFCSVPGTEVLIGGMDAVVRPTERARLLVLLCYK